jgi:hypothetical protein
MVGSKSALSLGIYSQQEVSVASDLALPLRYWLTNNLFALKNILFRKTENHAIGLFSALVARGISGVETRMEQMGPSQWGAVSPPDFFI